MPYLWHLTCTKVNICILLKHHDICILHKHHGVIAGGSKPEAGQCP